jgi:hypothetical protein
MASQPTPPRHACPEGWSIDLSRPEIEHFSSLDHKLVSISGFLEDPGTAISQASLQKFAQITPQYPGVRARLDPGVGRAWLARLSPLLSAWFGTPRTGRWAMQAWYSLVTTPPARLLPIQRIPHVDGTDPAQIAMMLYLHQTAHGGTAFFRHRATGFEQLTAETFPRYAEVVNAEAARAGFPPAAYPTDGAPHFERTHVAQGTFNRAIFYRGNILHSGVIDNDAPLSASPSEGRLTINAFFRPAPG